MGPGRRLKISLLALFSVTVAGVLGYQVLEGLNSNLYTVARGEEQERSERKLERAGANKVVLPYHIGGLRMAHAILKPTVVDFTEIATHSESLELGMEEIRIDPASSLAHLALKDSGIQEHGVIMVAIKRRVRAKGDASGDLTGRGK